MADSILEQLAKWHVALITSITEAAGYQQDLTGHRSMEPFLDGGSVNDLDVLCLLGEGEGAVVKEGQTFGPSGFIEWTQRFDAIVHVIERGGGSLAEDERITRILADIHKRIAADWSDELPAERPFCGGLANEVQLLPWEIGISPTLACTVVNVPIAVTYRVKTDNPYTLG